MHSSYGARSGQWRHKTLQSLGKAGGATDVYPTKKVWGHAPPEIC